MAMHKKDQPNSTNTPSSEPGLRSFRDILGQDWVVSHLKTAVLSRRLSHAYLFLGPEGVGKANTARALAAALDCAHPLEDVDACGECPSCRRLKAGTHPDFVMIAPPSQGSQGQIKIEQIRELRRLTEYPPLGEGWRVILIKPAEALNALNDAAANALLKILEEPPPRHVLVLTARGEAELLPTIVSRCQKLAFAPLATALVRRELEHRRGLSPSQAHLVAALSGGSLGWALRQDPEELLRRRDQVLSDLSRLSQGSGAAVVDWAQSLAKNRTDLETFLILAQLWYRDLLMLHAQAPTRLLAHQDLLPELDRVLAAGSPEAWFAYFQALGTAQRHLQANLNPELTLDILGLQLAGQGRVHDTR